MLVFMFALACLILVGMAWAIARLARRLPDSVRILLALAFASHALAVLVAIVSKIWPSSTILMPVVATALAVPALFAGTKSSEQPSDPAA